MAGQASVDRSAMNTAANQVDAAVTNIRGLQSNMTGYVEQLQGGWKGQAATAFHSAYEQFSADFQKVIASLDDIHEKLVGSHASYQATEESARQSTSKIQSALG